MLDDERTDFDLRMDARFHDDDRPVSFYKYVPNKTQDCSEKEAARRILRMCTVGELHFSPPSLLNDPFDCHPLIVPMSAVEQIGYVARKTAPDLRARGFLENAKSIKRDVKKRIKSPAACKSIFNRHVESWGVVSLTDSGVNMPLWAHYASGAAGVCVQFDFGRKDWGKNTDHLYPWPVEYELERPVVKVPFEVRAENQSLVKDTFLTKSPLWAYEAEWRLVSRIAGLRRIPSECVTAVTFGINADVDWTRSLAADIKEHSDTRCFRAVLDEKTFGMHREVL